MEPTLSALLAFAVPAALFLAVCVMNRAVAIAIFAAVLPVYLLRSAVGLPGVEGLPALPTTLLEVLFFELFIVWFFTDGLKKGAWRALGRWSYPMALILTGSTLGMLISPDLRGAAGLWRAYFIEPMLFFVVFVDVIRTARQRVAVLAGLGAALLVIGLSAVIQKATGYGIPNPIWQAETTRRVTSFFGFPNAIGLFAAPVIVLMAGLTLALFRSRRAPAKAMAVWPAAAALLGIAAIVFAVSEGAIVAAAAGLIILGLLTRPLRLPILITIIAACLVISLYPPATDYAADMISFRDDSGSVRVIIWRETAAMLTDHPIFGAGLSGYRQAIEPYHRAEHIEIFMYPHNLVLNFWSEVGLIGLAGFIWLFILFFRETVVRWRTEPRRWLPPALIAAMSAVLVHGLVDVPYLKNDLAFLFWILVGLTESLAWDKSLRAAPASVDKKVRS